MEMMIAMPTVPATPVNSASQSGASQASTDKSTATGFNDILSNAIKTNEPSVEKETTLDAKPTDGFMQAMAAAIYGVFQPAAMMSQQPTTNADGNTGISTGTTSPASLLPVLPPNNTLNNTATLTGTNATAQQGAGSIPVSNPTVGLQTEIQSNADAVTTERTKLPGEMFLSSPGMTNLSETAVSRLPDGASDVSAQTNIANNRADMNMTPATNNNITTNITSATAISSRQTESSTLGVSSSQQAVIAQDTSKNQEVSADTPVNALPEKPAQLTVDANANKNGGEWQSNNFEQRTDQSQKPLEQQNANVGSSQNTLPFHVVMEGQTVARSSDVPDIQSVQTTPVTDKYEVVSQIVENARMVNRSNNTEMIIKLKPEHLGELTFKVTVEQGVLTASFHSNNAEVRGIIEASLPQLKQDLNNQGIKLDNVGVFAGMDQFLSGDHRGGQQQQQGEVFIQRKNLAEFDEAATDLVAAAKTEVTTGVDYRV